MGSRRSRVWLASVSALVTVHALGASAATITGSYGVTASSLSGTVMFYAAADFPIHPYDELDNGSGSASSIIGFTTLAGQEAFLTMEFGDLERLGTTWTPGGCSPAAPFSNCATASNHYGEADAGANYFRLLLSGNPILTGYVASVTTLTDTDPLSPDFATATGSGTVVFTSGVGAYWTEVLNLTGGTGNVSLSIDSFDPVCAVYSDPCDFDMSSATLTFLPEPSTGALVGGVLFALPMLRRRFSEARR